MSEMMKAVRSHAFGGPEVLVYEDAPKPDPKPGEVLIRVHAVGVNPPDWYLRDIRVAIDAIFPLADARKAHERAATGHLQGKIVLTAG